jgi:dTDP-glucose 4,6-dehydratase
MTNQSRKSSSQSLELRRDCLRACADQLDIADKLKSSYISVTGGTGFMGSWLAEMISAVNDEYGLKIVLDLYARNTAEWKMKYPHLSGRDDIRLFSQDVRSNFQFQSNTNFVIHAAGIPNNRVHASNPLRVIQTTVDGISNTLDAASQLENLKRFINVSSGLVSGPPDRAGSISESDCFPISPGQLHLVYMDAKRLAENIAAVYRSQFRMPISTIRPFTFAGPYQEIDRPWAINNFLGDAIAGRDIRILGDGKARRSYLYGSDVAWWVLSALINGEDGGVYNFGSEEAINHVELAELISKMPIKRLPIALTLISSKQGLLDEFYPNLAHTFKSLGVKQTCSINELVDKTWRWFLSQNA